MDLDPAHELGRREHGNPAQPGGEEPGQGWPQRGAGRAPAGGAQLNFSCPFLGCFRGRRPSGGGGGGGRGGGEGGAGRGGNGGGEGGNGAGRGGSGAGGGGSGAGGSRSGAGGGKCGAGREHEHRESEQGGERGGVTHPRAPAAQQGERRGEGERQQTALPHRMEERPGGGLHEGHRGEGVGCAHFFSSPASSSRSRRISASSWGEAGREERACRTRRLAEPSRTRSGRSATGWPRVCSTGSRAL